MSKEKLAIEADYPAIHLAYLMREDIGGGPALQLTTNTFLTPCVMTGQTPSLFGDMDALVVEIEKHFEANPGLFGPKWAS